MRLQLSALLTLGAAAGLAAGCGGSDGPTGAHTYQIEIATPTLSVGQDSSVTVSASVRNVTQDRVLSGAPINYRSADYTIATVNNSGRVTGLKGGTTDILVVYRDDTARVPITVRANPITEFRIQGATPFSTGVTADAERRTIALGSGVGFNLTAGQTLETAILARDATGDVIICQRCTQITTGLATPSIQRRGVWSSTNTAVASVSNGSAFGRVTAFGVGTAKIIYTVPGDNLADTITINVVRRPLSSVSVAPADPNAPAAIKRGGKMQLVASPMVSSPTGVASDRRVTWESADTTLVKIDALGLATATSAAAAVGRTVEIRARSIPIAGVDTEKVGTITLTILN